MKKERIKFYAKGNEYFAVTKDYWLEENNKGLYRRIEPSLFWQHFNNAKVKIENPVGTLRAYCMEVENG